MDDRYRAHRLFLTDTLRREFDFSTTGQRRGLPRPALQKPCPENAKRIELTTRDAWPENLGRIALIDAIGLRQSRRSYSSNGLNLDELSFLLWGTQGIRGMRSRNTALRTVPSAGARHSFETYLFVRNVAAVPEGLYRYLPLDHQLVHVRDIPDMESVLARAAYNQTFVGASSVTFAWACIPYRMEWRYGLTAHRVILMDVGHVCQNLYLACEAIAAGTCAVGAYDQQAMDALIGLDGEDEFVVYVAPVGKVSSS